MPNFRGLDLDPGWIKREFAKLRQERREADAAAAKRSAALSAAIVDLDARLRALEPPVE